MTFLLGYNLNIGISGMSKFLISGVTPPARKILSIVVLLRSWYLQHWRIYFWQFILDSFDIFDF